MARGYILSKYVRVYFLHKSHVDAKKEAKVCFLSAILGYCSIIIIIIIITAVDSFSLESIQAG